MNNELNTLIKCNGDYNESYDCQKSTHCNCKEAHSCNINCVDEDSIFFSGLSTGENFDLSDGLWTEVSINGSIVVPLEKPLVEQIDSVNAKIDIISRKVIVTPGVSGEVVPNYEGKNVTGRKLIIEGLLCLATSYVSVNPNQSVHSFHGQVPFSAFIVIPEKVNGVDSLDINYMVSSCIEEVCIKSICDRTVNVTTTFVLSAAKSISTCNQSYFSDSGIDCNSNTSLGISSCADCDYDQKPIISGVCVKERLQTLLVKDSPTIKYWTEISVPEVLNIPCLKPDIDQILSINSKIQVMCQKVILTPKTTGTNLENLNLTGKKLIIEAILRQRITYVSKSDCQSVHSAHFDVPVAAYIMVPDTTLLTDKFKIFACIEDIFGCVLNDRQVFKNTTLFFKAQPIKCPIK